MREMLFPDLHCLDYFPSNQHWTDGIHKESYARYIEVDKSKGKKDIRKVAARHATIDLAKLLSDSQEKPVVVKSYTNANFVNLIAEATFFQNLEMLAEHLGATAETIINKAFILLLKETEDIDRMNR